MMKIKVTANVQLLHAGERFTQGDTADVDDHTAQDWIRQGWATETKATPRSKR